MIVQRLRPVFIALGLALSLGSCGGMAGFTSDHWPHWAGGEPNGVPPRPGAPGYDEFIAHQQSIATQAQSAAPGGQPVAAPPTAPAPPAAPAAAPTAAAAPAETDTPVGRGGLY
jgi:hypothetical protein